MSPTQEQTKKIHALINNLPMDDEEYREILSSFKNNENRSVQSSRELTVQQASELIADLEHILDSTPGLHDKVYATEKQIKKIYALWHHITTAKDREGVSKTLRSFLSHHFQVHDMSRIPRKKVSRIIAALRAMNNATSQSTEKN